MRSPHEQGNPNAQLIAQRSTMRIMLAMKVDQALPTIIDSPSEPLNPYVIVSPLVGIDLDHQRGKQGSRIDVIEQDETVEIMTIDRCDHLHETRVAHRFEDKPTQTTHEIPETRVSSNAIIGTESICASELIPEATRVPILADLHI